MSWPLLNVLALVLILAPFSANARCFDSVYVRLVEFQSSAIFALERLEAASTQAARIVDSEIQSHLGDQQLMRSLRGLNCTQVQQRFDEVLAQGEDFATLREHHDRIQLSAAYLYYRAQACQARKLLREDARPLLDEGTTRTIRPRLLHLALFAGRIRRLPEFSGRAWQGFAQALTATRDALAPAHSIRQAVSVACHCDPDPAPAPVSEQARATMRIADVLVENQVGEPYRGFDTPEMPQPAASPQAPPVLPARPQARTQSPAPEGDRTRIRAEARRMVQERQRRQEQARREARRREREDARPARIPSRRQLLTQTSAALTQGMQQGQQIPREFEWAMQRAMIESRERDRPLTRRELRQARARWDQAIANLRAAASRPGNSRKRFRQAMHDFIADLLTGYEAADATVLSVLLDGEGNCQSRTHILLSALALVPEIVPEGYQAGVQSFATHEQAVLIPTDPDNHEVIDIMSNFVFTNEAGEPRRRAPIYSPLLALRGLLEDRQIATGISEDDLLLRAGDPDVMRVASEREMQESATPPEGTQRWSSSTAAYSDAPIPDRITNPPPSTGEPVRGFANPTVSDLARGGWQPDARAARVEVAEGEDRYSHIRDSRVREFLRRDQSQDDFVTANPNITAEELVERWTAEIENRVRPDLNAPSHVLSVVGDLNVLTAISGLCTDSARLNIPCRNIPFVARVLRDFEARRDHYIQHPAELVAAIENGENIKLSRSAAQRRRLEQQPHLSISSLAQASAQYEIIAVSGSYPEGGMPPRQISDVNPVAPLWDIIADPQTIGPARSIEQVAAALAREAQADVQARTGESPGQAEPIRSQPTPQTPPTSTLDPAFEMNPALYLSALDHYLGTRKGHSTIATPTTLRSRRALDALLASIDLLDSHPDGVEVCGTRILRGDAGRILLYAALLYTPPRMPCPVGTIAGRTPEQEYERLLSECANGTCQPRPSGFGPVRVPQATH